MISPAVALAFWWSLFWSWHRMVELKLNANLSKLRGQTLESQATEIAGLCRARKWRSGDFMVRARIAKSV